MKKFEILDHTADIKGKAYGRDTETLFINAAGMLYSLMEFKYSRVNNGKTSEINISADTLENLMIRFLNELLYLAGVKRKAGKLLIPRITRNNEEYRLKCTMHSSKIDAPGREIKAATYHNVNIEKKRGIMAVSIIFDV